MPSLPTTTAGEGGHDTFACRNSCKKKQILVFCLIGRETIPMNRCVLIGPLTIELSAEVNCRRDSLTISMRPPSQGTTKEQVCRSKMCCSNKFSSF